MTISLALVSSFIRRPTLGSAPRSLGSLGSTKVSGPPLYSGLAASPLTSRMKETVPLPLSKAIALPCSTLPISPQPQARTIGMVTSIITQLSLFAIISLLFPGSGSAAGYRSLGAGLLGGEFPSGPGYHAHKDIDGHGAHQAQNEDCGGAIEESSMGGNGLGQHLQDDGQAAADDAQAEADADAVALDVLGGHRANLGSHRRPNQHDHGRHQ